MVWGGDPYFGRAKPWEFARFKFPMTLVLGGRRYEFKSRHKTKSLAQRHAAEWRRGGLLARVVGERVTPSYAVYVSGR